MMAAYPSMIQTTPAPYQIIKHQDAGSFNTALFDRFIDYTDRKDTTVKGYTTCIKQFARWMADNGIVQPQREDIKAYRDHLTGSGLATGTQAQYLRAVKHFFRWTASEGLYDNIADNLHGAKIRRDIHKKDALQREDVAKIAESIDRSTEAGKRIYTIYLLCVICGLRTIEIHRADVCDVKQIAGSYFLYIQGKGHDDKDAPVLLIPEVMGALSDYLAHRSAKPEPKSPLFTATSNRGKPGAFKGYKTDRDGNIIYKDGEPIKEYSDGRIATTTISTMIKDLLISAGYNSDRLTAHSLRHTSGTGAHKAGLDLYSVQHLMRHSDPATSEIYIHDDDHKAAEQKGRQGIYDYYFRDKEPTKILPELLAEIEGLTEAQQKQLADHARHLKAIAR